MANLTEIPQVPLPKPPPPKGGLGERINNLIINAIVDVINHVLGPISSMLQRTIENTFDGFEREAVEIFAPVLREMRKNEDMPEFAKKAIDDALAPTHPIQLAVLLPIVGAVLIAIVMAAVGAMLAIVGYAANRVTHPFRIDFATASAATHRGINNPKITKGDLYDQGWTDERIDIAEIATKKRADLGQLVELYRRGEMSQAAVKAELLAQEWTDEAINGLFKIIPVIPGVQDLVYFADRLAWNDQYSALAGLDADMDPRLTEWAQKHGLSPEWTKLYWRAHWQPIDLGLGFEMLHRGVITMDEMLTFLKAQKIPPALQKAYVQVAYNLPTRVDVRRAYKEQVVSLEEVRGVYLALGYEKKWADIMTAWTAKAYAPEEKDVTVADIRSALGSGQLSESEATDALKSLDVSDEAIGFYIAQAHYKRAQALQTAKKNAIRDKYVAGKIDRAAAAAQLTSLGLPASEIEIDLEEWTVSREAKTREPTPEQMRGFYLDDLVDVNAFRDSLKKLGYDDDDIALYVRAADAQKARDAAAETQRAATEQERLAKAERATAYQKAVADIDVQLAQQRQIIANSQAALNAGLSDAQIRKNEDTIEQLSAEIAAEREAIAKLNAQRTTTTNTLNARISAVLRAKFDKQISDAQTGVKQLGTQIAEMDTQIAQARLALLSAQSDDEKKSLKEYIASQQVEIATLREEIAAQQLIISQAQASLRNFITDEERQALESQLRDIDESVRGHQAIIAEYQAQQATLKAQNSASLNSDDRATLLDAIIAAKKEIAALQVSRAQARVESVGQTLKGG